MKSKKGFEVSINFIVMLILAIVVFAFGLYFVKNVFQQAGEIKASLDRDTEQRIELLLDRGDTVAFPITSKDITSGQLATFGLGILNIKNSTIFSIDIYCNLAIDLREQAVPAGDNSTWTFEIDPIEMQKNEKKIIPIAIKIPGSKPRGTYGFVVTVKDSITDENYGTPKQIYVNIV